MALCRAFDDQPGRQSTRHRRSGGTQRFVDPHPRRGKAAMKDGDPNVFVQNAANVDVDAAAAQQTPVTPATKLFHDGETAFGKGDCCCVVLPCRPGLDFHTWDGSPDASPTEFPQFRKAGKSPTISP